MKITKFQIELICSKDDLRPAIQGILIENGYAIATDCHMLVIMRLKDMGMQCLEVFNGKIIKSDIFKKINNRKLYVKVFDGKIDIDGYIVSEPFIDERFPDYKDVLPVDNMEVGIIGLAAEKLNIIQKVFNCTSLNLSFSGKCKAISIQPFNFLQNDFQALLMPCITEMLHKDPISPFVIAAREPELA